MSANIGLSLSTAKLQVAPGESVEATVTIRNQSQVVDQFGIRIEGLQPTWWTLSTSNVSLFPGERAEAKLTIHPPREAEARAGNYSFQVRAVSQANPEEMTEEKAYLVLRGFLVWNVEMSPTKVAGTSGTYRLTATNSSNTDITLVFEGKDPEEALDYTFSHEKITVSAGESALITVQVRPRKGQKEKLYRFQVLVRPAEAKLSSKEARTIDGQLDYQLRHLPWKWILVGATLVAVAILVWKVVLPLLNPPAPVIDFFGASPQCISARGDVTLSWNVSGATAVTIDQGVGTVEATTGTRTVHPTATTTYTLTATNKAGSVTDIAKVTTPPTINGFAPEPQKINKSGLSTLHWETSDADTITITPDTGRQIETAGLGVASGSCQVFPDTTTTYTLEASNAAGSVTLTATVTVPLPVIHSFDAQPKSCISIGETSTLSWTVSSDEIAPIIRINIANDNPSIEPFSPPLWEMSRDISMNKTTTFTLEAENQNGSATATVTVTVGCVVMAPIEPSPTYPIHPNIRDLLP